MVVVSLHGPPTSLLPCTHLLESVHTPTRAAIEYNDSTMASSDSAVHTLTGDADKWSAYSKTRSTINEQPLSKDDLDKLTRYFHATLYLCLGMLYLKDNPLLAEPLKKEHIKPRLLGHWGSDAGQSFT